MERSELLGSVVGKVIIIHDLLFRGGGCDARVSHTSPCMHSIIIGKYLYEDRLNVMQEQCQQRPICEYQNLPINRIKM